MVATSSLPPGAHGTEACLLRLLYGADTRAGTLARMQVGTPAKVSDSHALFRWSRESSAEAARHTVPGSVAVVRGAQRRPLSGPDTRGAGQAPRPVARVHRGEDLGRLLRLHDHRRSAGDHRGPGVRAATGFRPLPLRGAAHGARLPRRLPHAGGGRTPPRSAAERG